MKKIVCSLFAIAALLLAFSGCGSVSITGNTPGSTSTTGGTPFQSGQVKPGGTSGTPPILDSPIEISYSPAGVLNNLIESFDM